MPGRYGQTVPVLPFPSPLRKKFSRISKKKTGRFQRKGNGYSEGRKKPTFIQPEQPAFPSDQDRFRSDSCISCRIRQRHLSSFPSHLQDRTEKNRCLVLLCTTSRTIPADKGRTEMYFLPPQLHICLYGTSFSMDAGT